MEEARKFVSGNSKIKTKKILKALRDKATIPLKQLETGERRAAVNIMKANTPIKRLISRHTRELLRKYAEKGYLHSRIAQREVEDRFVTMTEAEREVYELVENYISSTYNNAAPEKRTAIGFVMTIYRRRLASSFAALRQTLENRVKTVGQQFSLPMPPESPDRLEEDVFDDELATEAMDADEAARLEGEALAQEEKTDIKGLLLMAKKLPTDTKANVLKEVLRDLRQAGYGQVMVFTQYTDTLDFLRRELVQEFGPKAVICFFRSGW